MVTTKQKENRIVRLKDYKLYPEDDYLFMSLTYEIEDEHVVKEIALPKLATCIPINREPLISHSTDHHELIRDIIVEAGPMMYQVFKGKTEDADDVYLTEKILYEKPTEMTLEEIEKKLGYKIKIVSEKERTNA